jgi:carbon monoxide dehydrogenase subunit G
MVSGMPHRGTLVPLLAALALAPVLAGGAAAQRADAPFSAEERRRLVAGELVQRPIARTEGRFHFIGGTSWQRVDAPPARVWRAINDVSNYPVLIPGVEEARLEAEGEERRVVYLRHRYAMVGAAYYVLVRADPAHRTLHFDLDRSRPHDVRAGRGFLTVDPYRGGSIVTWGVMADVGGGLLTGIFGPLLREWILRVPSCVRGHLHPDEPAC